MNNHTGDVARMTGCETVIIKSNDECKGTGVHVYTLTYEDDSIYMRNALTHQFSHVVRMDEECIKLHFTCLETNDEEE